MPITRLFTEYIRRFRRSILVEEGARIEPAHLAKGGKIRVGQRSRVRFGSIFMPAGGSIEIGSGVTVNHYCILHGENGLKIGHSCLIAARVSIFASSHGYKRRDQSIRNQGMVDRGGISIGDDCWIGTGAIILDGVKIGNGCVIGAGAVVTRDMPDFAVAVGNPARVIADRS